MGSGTGFRQSHVSELGEAFGFPPKATLPVSMQSFPNVPLQMLDILLLLAMNQETTLPKTNTMLTIPKNLTCQKIYLLELNVHLPTIWTRVPNTSKTQLNLMMLKSLLIYEMQEYHPFRIHYPNSIITTHMMCFWSHIQTNIQRVLPIY